VLCRDRWREDQLEVIDQCRLLTHRIFLAPGGAKTVLFSGMAPQLGCTSLVVRTAETLAVCGSGSVCLVDGNAYSPRVHTLFDLANPHGLSEAIVEDRPATDYIQRLDESNLWVLSYGRQPFMEVEKAGRSRWMKRAIAKLSVDFDYVLVDSPPATQYSDAVTLGSATDGVALIMGSGSTRKDVAAQTISKLKKSGINILGIVLTARSKKR